jgi:hypothetical protein
MNEDWMTGAHQTLAGLPEFSQTANNFDMFWNHNVPTLGLFTINQPKNLALTNRAPSSRWDEILGLAGAR